MPRPHGQAGDGERDHDDLQIHRSWRTYAPDQPDAVHAFCYELSQRDAHEEDYTRYYKALRLLRVTRVPRYLRQQGSTSPELVYSQQRDLLAALREQQILFTNLIAKSPDLPLVFAWGVQAVGATPEQAIEAADEAYAVLERQVDGTYQQLEYAPISVEDAESLVRYQQTWDHVAVGRGRPLPQGLGHHGPSAWLDGSRTDVESTAQQLETFIRGMGERSFMLSLVTTPVSPAEMTAAWRNVTKRLSDVRSNQQGTRSFTAGVALPLGMGLSDGTSAGESHSEGTAAAETAADSLSQARTTGVSESLSQGQTYGVSDSISVAQSISQSDGRSVSLADSVTHGASLTESASLGESLSQGLTVGETIQVGESIASGASVASGESVQASASTGESVSVGETVSQTATVGQSASASQGVSQSQSVTQGQSAGVTQSVGATQGQSASQAAGQSASNGLTSGISVSEGLTQTLTEALQQSLGLSAGETTGLNTSDSRTEGHSVGVGSQELPVSVSNQTAVSQALAEALSANSGLNVGLNGGASLAEALSQTLSQNLGQNLTLGETLTNTLGQSASQSQTVGSSEGVSTSAGVGVGSTQGLSQGVTVAEAIAAGQTVGQGMTAGQSIAQGTSLTHGQSLSQGASMAQGQSTAQALTAGQTVGQGLSSGQTVAAGQTVGQGASSTHTQGLSQGQTQGVSQGVSRTEAAGVSQSVADTIAASQSRSASLTDTFAATRALSSQRSGSLGIVPSISYSVSKATFDESARVLGDFLEAQMRRYLEGIESGAWLYQMTLICPTRHDLVGGAGLLKSAFWSTGGKDLRLPQPFHTIDRFEPDEKERLLAHARAWTTYRRREPRVELAEPYLYSTLVSAVEAAALCHAPTAEATGLLAVHDSMPVMAMPHDRRDADLYLGKLINGETAKVTDTRYGLRLEELTHILAAGTTGSGKTTTLVRLLTQAAHTRRTVTRHGTDDEGLPTQTVSEVPAGALVLDWKRDYRALATTVEPDRFKFFSLADPTIGDELRFNLLAVPDAAIPPAEWVATVADLLMLSMGFGEYGRSIIYETIDELYRANRLDPYVLRDAQVDDDGVVHRDAITLPAVDVADLPAGAVVAGPDGRSIANVYTCPELSRLVGMEHVAVKVLAEIERLADPQVARTYGTEHRNRLQSVWRRMQYFTPGQPMADLLACDRSLTDRRCVAVTDLVDPDRGLVTVVEADGLDFQHRRLVLGGILMAVWRYGTRKGDGVFDNNGTGPGTFVLLEEAHELLAGSDSEDRATAETRTSLYESMLRRARSLGMRIVVSVQNPSQVPVAIVSNTSTVISHRLYDDADRKVVAGLLNWANTAMGGQLREVRYLGELPVGFAVVRTDAKRHFTESAPVQIKVDPAPLVTLDDTALRRLLTRT